MNALNKNEMEKVLFVDDEKAILKSMKRFARNQFWCAEVAESGEQALEMIQNTTYAVIVSDMRMPKMNGAEFLNRAKEVQPDAVRILLSGQSDIEDLQNAINDAGIFNYLSKPWEASDLQRVIEDAIGQRAQEQEISSMHKKTKEKSVTLGKIALVLDRKAKERDIEVEQAMTLVESMHSQMQTRLRSSIKVLNQIIDLKEGRDVRHTRFVTSYAEKIANSLNLSEADTDELTLAAMLHRIGMIGLPDHFSAEPYYKLSKEDKDQYNTYPLLGEAALSHAESLRGAAKLIRHHKEWINGTGFPDGLADKQVPTGSKIIGVLSDFFELSVGKLEQNISNVDEAITYIQKWTGKKYDTAISEVFLGLLDPDCEELTGTIMITSDKLIENMILAQDVNSKAGAVLLSKGTVITSSVLAKIISFEEKGDEYVVNPVANQLK